MRRVEDGFATGVARGAADGLDEGAFASEEAFFVGVEDGNQRDFRHVQSFAQQVDADQDVKGAKAQVADDFHALDGVHVGVDVAHAHVVFHQVVGEVFRHFFGERGDEDALVGGDALADFAEDVFHLAVHRADFDFGVKQAGRAHDLFDGLAAVLAFVVAGGSGDVDGLRGECFEFFESERAVIQRRRQAEAVINERFFARAVASIHAV